MKKQFLLANSGVITTILGVSGLELHSSCTKPVNFFGALSSLGGGGTIFVWRGTSSDLGAHGPGMPPVAPGLITLKDITGICRPIVPAGNTAFKEMRQR